MTAAVESLHRQFPGQYVTGVQTTCQSIWDNNPRIDRTLTQHGCDVIRVNYDLIHQSNQLPVHFMEGFIRDLSKTLNIDLRLQVNRPFLYLSDAEKLPPDMPYPFVLVNSGVKSDFTCKGAGTQTYQEIVDHFRGRLTFVQIGEANVSHFHKPLKGVVNMIGKTSARELIRLAYHSALGVGGVTFLHHIYAALEKPYVCYLGGREPKVWESYQTAIMLDTIGQLPCALKGGCWKSRVVKLNDGGKDDNLCSLPVIQHGAQGDETIPKCMELLGSEAAIKAIENMIQTGVICLNR